VTHLGLTVVTCLKILGVVLLCRNELKRAPALDMPSMVPTTAAAAGITNSHHRVTSDTVSPKEGYAVR
jgi:hypothetical protein